MKTGTITEISSIIKTKFHDLITPFHPILSLKEKSDPLPPDPNPDPFPLTQMEDIIAAEKLLRKRHPWLGAWRQIFPGQKYK